jgi:hypothetical protein
MNHLETLILALMKRKAESKSDQPDSDGSSTSPLGLEPTPPMVQDGIGMSPSTKARKETLLKEKSTELVQKQLSADYRTNSGMLKLFKQVSGNSDDAGNPVATSRPPINLHISSSTSSKGLLGGLIPLPGPSLSQRTLTDSFSSQRNLVPTLSHQSLFGEKPNPKTLNAKRSFSRTYSDVLARQEAGNEPVSRLLEPKEDDGHGILNQTHSLGSDISDSQPYSPVVTYALDSPGRQDLLTSLSPRSSDTQPSKSPVSFPDTEDLLVAHSASPRGGFLVEDPNRLSIESGSTVRTSDTIKKEDPKRKPPLPESRSSFSLSNFSLRPFARNDNKSPVPRPNLSTITEGLADSLFLIF